MPPLKAINRKRQHQTGNKNSTRSKKGSLSLNFVQDLLEESLVANGISEKQKESPRSPSVFSDMTEDSSDEGNIPLNGCFEVKELPGKGFGIVAQLPIPAGTAILSEAPLFILLASTPMPDSFSELDALITTQGLSPNVKIAISKLANVYPRATTHPAIGILKTNSLPVTMKDEAGREKKAGGLFEIVCRLNHSCVPNAVARWEKNLGERGEMRVRAKTIIQVGEEITISYGVAAEHLKEKFGFDCDCKKCMRLLSVLDDREIDL